MCSLLRRIPAIGTLSSLHPMAPTAAPVCFAVNVRIGSQADVGWPQIDFIA